MDLGARVRDGFSRRALAVERGVLDQLSQYIGLLAKWNRSLNLTGFSLSNPSDEALDRLLIEPVIAAGLVAPPPTSAAILDVGSGGGSPAIPFALALPGTKKLTMVEARARKAAFLRDVIREMSLPWAIVVQARLEESVGRLEAADIVTVRAVRLDEEMAGSLAVLLKPAGQLAWFTTAAPDDSPQERRSLAHVRSIPLIPERRSQLVLYRKSHS